MQQTWPLASNPHPSASPTQVTNGQCQIALGTKHQSFTNSHAILFQASVSAVAVTIFDSIQGSPAFPFQMGAYLIDNKAFSFNPQISPKPLFGTLVRSPELPVSPMATPVLIQVPTCFPRLFLVLCFMHLKLPGSCQQALLPTHSSPTDFPMASCGTPLSASGFQVSTRVYSLTSPSSYLISALAHTAVLIYLLALLPIGVTCEGKHSNFSPAPLQALITLVVVLHLMFTPLYLSSPLSIFPRSTHLLGHLTSETSYCTNTNAFQKSPFSAFQLSFM